MVGPGASDYGNIGIMPTRAIEKRRLEESYPYRAAFSHLSEKISPGYYSVALESTGIFVEVAACGLQSANYLFDFGPPSMGERTILFDMGHALSDVSCDIRVK